MPGQPGRGPGRSGRAGSAASASRAPSAGRTAAAPKPAIAGTVSSPARRARSWSPPTQQRSRRRPAAHEQRADARAGRRACGRDTDSRSAPRSSKAIGTWPAACGGVDVHEHAALAAGGDDLGHRLHACPPRGCPTARARAAVSGRTAASSSSGSTRPVPSTPTTVTLAAGLGGRAARRSARPRPAPGGRPARPRPSTAAAMASVAPLVNTTYRAGRRAGPATCSRAVLDRDPRRRGPRRGCGRGRPPVESHADHAPRPPRAAAATSTRGRGSAAPGGPISTW